VLVIVRARRIRSAALFDQFPWTDHAEVAVHLVKA
jgi:tRNA/tmRNA/rRNA uracil-C5-methylase (TrmA/RlmC/RlmD family)